MASACLCLLYSCTSHYKINIHESRYSILISDHSFSMAILVHYVDQHQTSTEREFRLVFSERTLSKSVK